jgi:hypothetical protein
MAVGYSAIGKCFETEQEALDAHYSTKNTAVTANYYEPATDKHAFVIVRYQKAGGIWQEQVRGCYKLPTQSPTCHIANVALPSTPGATGVVGECTLPDPLVSGLPPGFDYSILGALFVFSFSIVVGLYLFGRSAGAIVNIFKPK